MAERIKQIEELVAEHLENGEKIWGFDVKNLTAPGENYGSTMLSLTIKTKNDKTDKENTLHTVVKLVPDDPLTQEMFNTPVSFKVEMKFYTTMVPMLDKYLKEKGIKEGVDFVPKNYGCRLSLDPKNQKVDMDAIIMLENIKLKGYKTGNKLIGLDLDSSKVILDTLAKFHASCLAFKVENKEMFDKYIKQYTWHYEEDSGFLEMVVAEFEKVLKEHQISQDIFDLTVNALKRKIIHTNREPWSTLVHMDSWVNNLMLKYEENKAVHAMLVDFQCLDYKSPQHDLIFFVFSSIEDDALEPNVDYLLNYYYDSFILQLKKLDIDTSPFSKQSFDKELKNAANECQFFHIITMLPPLLEKMFVDLNFNQNYDPKNSETTMWGEKHQRRILFVVNEFLKRGWVQKKF